MVEKIENWKQIYQIDFLNESLSRGLRYFFYSMYFILFHFITTFPMNSIFSSTSVRQPAAEAIARGIKNIENRSRPIFPIREKLKQKKHKKSATQFVAIQKRTRY